MVNNLLKKLKDNKLINENNKVSPWLERKISDELKEEVFDKTCFILVDVNLSDRIKTLQLGITEQPLCIVCQNPTKYFRSYNNYAKYCSHECERKSEEKSKLMKAYASDGRLSIGKKGVEIQREKYNGLLAIQADLTISQKIAQTCIEKYGVDNYFKTDISKNIVRKNREKYKKTFEEIINISKESLQDQYVYRKNTITQCAKYFGCSPMYVWNKLYEHEIPINYDWSTSSYERELADFLENLNIKFKSNDRQLIKPKEIDIFIESHNIGIEINGLWFHHDGIKNRGKEYHKNKHLLCKNAGIKLIQFYDTEWILKNDICKSIILSKLGLTKKIFARKCEIRDVEETVAKHFLDENHIQGNIKSKYKIGLFHENELVSLMTFGKDRFNKNSSNVELHRFCNKIGITVIGGASKLFKHFTKSFSYNIISYCDMRIFSGDLYESLGFDFSHTSSPNYFYFNSKKYILENRIKYQKHKLKTILENFDPELTEYENMIKNNFFRIWDCGNKVYVWKRK